jgi:dTDP-4-dehydrorhamnose reductase
MKILVMGAAGMLGHRAYLELRKHWPTSTYATIRKARSHYYSFKLFGENVFDNFDVSDWQKTEKLLNELKPDFIVNAIGITIRKEEIKDLNRALDTNSFFPHRLLKWAQRNNSRVIHFSTDCVFSGDKGMYTESSNPSATDIYGRTKFLGEITDHRGLTLRFSAIGRELESHTELLEWFLSQKGQVKGFKKAIYSGVTTKVIAEEVVRILKFHPDLQGIFQLSSSPISKYDLLGLIKEKFNLSTEILPEEGYVSDKTLVCKKYADKTGFKAPTWDKMLDGLINDSEITYV